MHGDDSGCAREPDGRDRRTISRHHASPAVVPPLPEPPTDGGTAAPSPHPRERPMTKIQETGDKVLANVERVIVGKHHEVRLALVALLCRGHLLIEDVPGTGKTVLAKAIARSLGCTFRRIQFTPDLLPSDVTGLSIYNQKTQEFEFRPGPDHEPGRARGRDQPGDAQDAVEPPRVHGGAPGHDRRHHPSDAGSVPRHRHAEPDRVRGHVRPARGAARPVHAADPPGVPATDRGDRHPRRAEAEPPTRGARGGARGPGPARPAVGRSRDLRRLDRVRLHRARRERHAAAPRCVSGRVAPRIDRALPRRPGAGRAAGPRLRHPGRHQGAGGTRPRPSADHQDQLVDPRRPGGPGRPRDPRRHARSTVSARPAAGRPSCDPTTSHAGTAGG